ncbi:hypothetical protein D3C84_1109090 [compost metagenome]
MPSLAGIRLLETVQTQALRVDAVEHAPDHAVLAGAVRALQHQQQGVLGVGPEPPLLIVEPGAQFGQGQLRGLSVQAEVARRILGKRRRRIEPAIVENAVGQA